MPSSAKSLTSAAYVGKPQYRTTELGQRGPRLNQAKTSRHVNDAIGGKKSRGSEMSQKALAESQKGGDCHPLGEYRV